MSIAETLRRHYMIVAWGFGFSLDNFSCEVESYLKERLLDADDASVKRKTLEILEYFWKSGQFDIEIWPENRDADSKPLDLSPGEILSKIRDALDSGNNVNEIFFQTWLFLSEEGFEVAKDYYTKSLDLDEKILLELDEKGCLSFREVVGIVAKDFSTDDPEEIKHEASSIVESIDLELGVLGGGIFEKCEFGGFFYFRKMSLNEWQELLEEEDPEKKLWIRNTEETTKRIQEWREKGSKGKVFPEWYECEGLL